MNTKELDQLANEIEQGFMQRGGWKACRYLLGKLADKVEQSQTIVKLAIAWQQSFVHGRDVTDEGFSVADEAAEQALYDAAKAARKDNE